MEIKVKNVNGKLENNLEGAKIELVMDAIRHAQDVIEVCFGQNPYPASMFEDEEIEELYYQLNSAMVALGNRKVRDFDKKFR